MKIIGKINHILNAIGKYLSVYIQVVLVICPVPIPPGIQMHVYFLHAEFLAYIDQGL